MGRNRKAVEASLRKKEEMEKAERAVKTLGLPLEGQSPQQVLLDEIARTAGHVRWLGELIANLEPDSVGWGIAAEEKRTGVGEMETNIDLTTTTKVARPSVWVELYQKERAHLVHVAKVAIQCGIAERQIKLAEEQGHMIANAFRELIEDPELALNAMQVAAARTIASKVLRAMSAMTPGGGSGVRPYVVPAISDGE
jgi:hypothetical protein